MGEQRWRGQFVRYLIARALASAGANLVAVILAFAVLSVGGDAFWVGVVLAGSVGAQLLALPISGVLADRVPRRTIAVSANLLLAAVHLTMGSALVLHPDWLAPWMFAVAACVAGAASATTRPALQGVLVELVPTESLQPANAWLRLVLNLAHMAVPGLGAVLGAAAGFGQVLLAAAVAVGVSAAMLATLREGRAAREPAARWRRNLSDGWAALTGRTWLWVFMLQGALAVPLWLAGYQLLGPVVAAEQPAGLQMWGWAVSSFAAGLVLGSLIALRWRPQRIMCAAVCAMLVWPAPLALLALDVHLAWLLPAMLVAGAGLDLSIVFHTTAMQQHVPERLIGRVSSLSEMGALLLVPVAYVLAGAVAATLGAATVLWVCFAGILLTTAALLAVRSIRTLPRLDPAAQPTSPATVAT